LQELNYIFQTFSFPLNFLELQQHHEVFNRAYHVSIYAKRRSTPKSVELRTLCQPTPFKNV
jgi:hypothetical protein